METMKDWSNYYAVTFYPTEVGFSTYVNGVWADKVRAYRPIDSTHPATLTLALSGATFKVNDDAVAGSPTIMTWTDPNNLFPTGIAIVPVTNIGTNAVWDSISGKPA
jgi:hypothetical protein